MGKPTVIFDLDGTLADTSGDLLAAANACFHSLGHGDVLQAGRDSGVALHGGLAMLRRGFGHLGQEADEDQIKRLYPMLLDHYGTNICRETYLYDGAREAVADLSGAGYAVGICTNKPEGLAERLMQALGFRDAFASLIGADTLSVRKPDPAPLVEAVKRAGGDASRACLVGDSDTDRSTARAAGMASVLVTFLPQDEDMAALQPEALLDHYRDLTAVVERLEL